MSGNRTPLPIFVGINFIGFSIMIAGLLIAAFPELNMRYSSTPAIVFMIAVIVAILNFLAGFGLCMLRSWGRTLANILLVLAIISTAIYSFYYMVQLFSFSNSLRIGGPEVSIIMVQVGVFIFILGVLIGTFLFVNNHRVIKALENNRTKEF